MISITLPLGWDAAPQIYEPWTSPPMLRPRFGVRVPLDLIDVKGFSPFRPDAEAASVHTYARPEVHPNHGTSWLIAALQRADACNISRDKWLSKQQLRIVFEPKPYGPTRYNNRSGVMLLLHKVHIL